jgi:hypothetical protein
LSLTKIIGVALVLLLAGTHAEAARSRTQKSAGTGKAKIYAASKQSKAKKRKKVRVRRARRVVWNPVIRGSRESMLRQNEEINRLQLRRLQDEYDLEQQILLHELVPIEETLGLQVAQNLPHERRFCKPWTYDFLRDLSGDFHRQFRKPILVTSAIRTVHFQKDLRRWNRNAAPEEGDLASSHLAGLTIDISKRGLSRKQKRWIDAYLKRLVDENLIEGAEERRQPVYHIMVYERYSATRDVEVADKLTTD